MEWIVAEPLRRQQARRRRGRVVRRQAPRRPPQHPLADRRVRFLGRQHHAAAAGARLDPRSLSSVDEIRLNEQTIVYCLHEKIGHLGIFVSAERRQARDRRAGERARADRHAAAGPVRGDHRGHAARDAGAASTSTGRYLIQFAPRTIDDILALDDGREDEQAFEVVNRVSQINQGIYDTFVSPIVKAMSNEATRA